VIGLAAVLASAHLVRTRQHRTRERYLARCVEDRTQALQAEMAEHAHTGDQLRQAQKLEAVGQLAGGIAHDFNNLLTVINGYTELQLGDSRQSETARTNLREVLAAGERAAGLTRQLLAFSRKQVLAPRILDLNAAVSETGGMLRRLIGDDVILATVMDPAIARVKVDPVQLQQVLLNLAVNARDAMPRGGKLTLETMNVFLDETYTHNHADVVPGEFVLLAVTDTGHGMDSATLARMFEPFFTTKGPGEGTGLGLATVYGIIRQSGGHIAVYSEPGRGTTFKVYFPRVEEAAEANKPHPGLTSMPRGDETILLAEDEPALRALASRVLQSCGYTVLEGKDGEHAAGVAEAHAGPIHLLVTDVVMPNLGGRQLAERLHEKRPGMKVLFLSGYTDDAVVRHGVLAEEVAFLQKPYTPFTLAEKVRQVLDTAGAVQGRGPARQESLFEYSNSMNTGRSSIVENIEIPVRAGNPFFDPSVRG
jgi:two-component system cell cycle sensor histidine kinase/response regulator CckA